MSRRATARGLTLIELAVALAIVALLGTAAAPPLREMLANARLREAGHVLQAEALRAQSEAVKRNGVVRLAVDGAALALLDRTQDPPLSLGVRVLPAQVSADAAANVDFGSEGRPPVFGRSHTVGLSMAGVICGAQVRCPALRVDAGGAVRLCADKAACN